MSKLTLSKGGKLYDYTFSNSTEAFAFVITMKTFGYEFFMYLTE